MFHVKREEWTVKKNECYEVRITGYTSEGQGVAHVEGMAVFVPRVIAGELCRIKILKVGKTAAYGKLEELLEPSDTQASAGAAAACSSTWTMRRNAASRPSGSPMP